ncbi:glycosyltransferase family 2 protein [Winogradskyella endarachnes]|uniref:Glycosyltransferase n=1 Tax=Winogradskyella endarachnes TaxID=2681965 RepID=A0A6L6U611_9FLAO|nr:glycosyltransferase family 2 protein [Winogradskyella endarachnes]MUU77651.1 glycosyltransferase [Winogradskyella endarachnes]
MSVKSSNKISIITINYNNVYGLKLTAESVLNQTFSNFEYIIIDGDSNDGSKAYLQTITRDNFICISEPDSGIYNAMNKGIEKASGDYLLFLNSGDVLENDNVIETIQPYLEQDISVLSGNIIFNENSGKRLREHPNKMTFSYLVGNAISHPSTFIKKSLFVKYGNYSEEYKIVSDWAFFLKVLGLNNESYKKIPEVISIFDTKGVSTNSDNLKSIYAERQLVLKTFFPRIFNNDGDTLIFNHFIHQNKRFRMLKEIENYSFFRKVTTLKLKLILWFAKLFSKPSK